MYLLPRRGFAVAGFAAVFAPAIITRARSQGTALVPNQPVTLASVIAADPRIANFAAMLGRTSVHPRLSMPGQWTIFAPADSGFNWMPVTVRDSLLGNQAGQAGADTSRANSVALQHVVPSVHSAQEFRGKTMDLKALNGGILRIDGNLTPTEIRAISTPGVLGAIGANAEGPAKIVVADISTTNGMLHIIDTVLLP